MPARLTIAAGRRPGLGPLLGLLLVLLVAATPDDADDQAHYVDGLVERHLYELAVDEARAFLDAHPGHEAADRMRYRLACALFELDRTGEALPLYRQLAGRDGFPWRAEANLRLGQCALDAGKPDEAAAALSTALQLGEDYLQVPARFLLGEAEFQRGRFAQAAPAYAAVLARDPTGPYADGAAVSLAWCALRTGALEQAASRAEAALGRELPPDLVAEMLFVEGEARLQAGRPDAALEAYAAVTGGPFADAALRGIGFARAALDDDAGAAAAFARLLEQHPDSRFAAEAALQLGIHRLQAGDAAGAGAALADPRLPDDAPTAYWRARAAAEQGRTEQALALLDRAESRHPDDALRAHLATARGDLLAAAGRAADAAQAYERAGSPQALHAAAVARLNAGDAAGALSLLERIDGDDPERALTWGEALFALQRYAEAAPAFERAASAGPPALRPRAASRRAWCAFLQGDLADAAARFGALPARFPGTPEADDARVLQGRCLQQLGDADGARRAYAEALESDPDGPRADECLLALAHLGDDAQRLDLLARLVEQHGDSPLVPAALLELGDGLSAGGDGDGAARCYRALIDRFPTDEHVPAARYGLAWCLQQQGRFEPAADALQELLDGDDARRDAPAADPDLSASALELLAWCRGRQGRPQQAEQAWRALRARGVDGERARAAARGVADAWCAADQPDRALAVFDALGDDRAVGPSALAAGALLALDQGEVDGAQQRVERALRGDADGADVEQAAFFVAEARFEAGDDARAVPLYAAAAAATHGSLVDRALYKQGFALLRSGDPAGAGRCFAKLVQVAPDSPLEGEALFLAGEACFRQEHWAVAADWTARLLSEQPDHAVAPKARFRLGLALGHLERWAECEQQLAELARTAPDFENLLEAELWRGRALAQQNKDRAAQAALQRVIAGDRGLLGARARLELGRLHVAAGRTEEGLSEFLKVAVLYAQGDEVAEALLRAGDCLARLGDLAAAADRYREVLDAHPDTPWADDARARLAAH